MRGAHHRRNPQYILYFADHPPKSSAIPSDKPKKVTASAGVLEEPLLQLGIAIE